MQFGERTGVRGKTVVGGQGSGVRGRAVVGSQESVIREGKGDGCEIGERFEGL